MPSEGRGILSPVRLPVPPLQPKDCSQYSLDPQRSRIGARRACENAGVRPNPDAKNSPGTVAYGFHVL